MNSLQLAKAVAEQASKAKALNIKILDLRKVTSYTDYFVICSGTSDRQMRAISERTRLELKKHDIRPFSSEGEQGGQWILADYGDVVLHVFNEESRHHYDLEGFWKRAPRVRMSSSTVRKKTKTKKKVAVSKPKKPKKK
jgi:ribosome-associated protein